MIHFRILLPNSLYSVQDYSLDETITSMLDQLQTEGQCCGMADWSEFNSPSVKGSINFIVGSSDEYDPLRSFGYFDVGSSFWRRSLF